MKRFGTLQKLLRRSGGASWIKVHNPESPAYMRISDGTF
jgi:hypothetical protein